jgi:hypothetical protein
MTTRKILILVLSLTILSCGQSVNQDDKDNSEHKKTAVIDTIAKTSTPDTSNQYIYDFMKVVIADQKLDLSYGLTIEPEQGSDLLQGDKIFLKTLIFEKTKPEKDTGNWRRMTFNQLPKCLTKGDIDEMLSQKEKLSNFTWNNSRLGFSPTNDKNWYCFSRPLFSKNRNKVVMFIRNLCPGLCGTGRTVVFTKQNNKWISQTVGQWIH